MEMIPPEKWSPKMRLVAKGFVFSTVLSGCVFLLGTLAEQTGSDILHRLAAVLGGLWLTLILLAIPYYILNGWLKYVALTFFSLLILLFWYSLISDWVAITPPA